jgi:uncharacterized membrane protein YiaA
MDQNTLMTVMTAFVVIAGLALVVQMAVMIGLYKATRSAEQRIVAVLPQVEAMLPQVEKLVQVSHTSIDQVREQVLELTGKTSEILSLAHLQVGRVDEVLADATQRARVQLERAELIIEDSLSRAQQTIGLVHSGVMRPLREIQGITAGVRAAILFLSKGARSNVNQITQDEEMFI